MQNIEEFDIIELPININILEWQLAQLLCIMKETTLGVEYFKLKKIF